MSAAVMPSDPGRAALAHALRDLEMQAGYGSDEPRRSRAQAIKEANIACREARLPVLNSKTVSDWFRLGRVAGDFEPLWRLVTVLLCWSGRSASAAERGVWKQRWELARVAEPRRPDPVSVAPPPLGWLRGEVDPVGDLEVHPAIQARGKAPGRADPLPVYGAREHDLQLQDVIGAAQKRSRLLVLVGDSSTGKTRSLWEAVRRLPDHWRIWRPADRTALLAGLERQPSLARTVLWLNELQRYLLPHNRPEPGEQTAASLTTLLDEADRGPLLVVGTLWHQHHTTLIQPPSDVSVPDLHQQARALLSRGTTLIVPPAFTASEITALRGQADSDARLEEALGYADGRITQYLAGARELIHRFDQAPSEVQAVLNAAADARRLGVGDDLPRAFLYSSAAVYLDPHHWAAQSDTWRAAWFTRALDYTGRPCKGVPGPLTPTPPPPGQGPTEPDAPLRLADYLLQHITDIRRYLFPPEGFWDAVAAHYRGNTLSALAEAAEARLRLRIADQLYRQAADTGDTSALGKLAQIRDWIGDREGAEQLARQAAGAGDTEALWSLVRARAKDGDESSAYRLAQEVGEAGDTFRRATWLADALTRNPDGVGRLFLPLGWWVPKEVKMRSKLLDADTHLRLSLWLAPWRPTGPRQRDIRTMLDRLDEGDQEGAKHLFLQWINTGDVSVLEYWQRKRAMLSRDRLARVYVRRPNQMDLLSPRAQQWGLKADGSPEQPWR
ncbi:hypothetical protein [Streptomyces sp. NPDC020298]|uniref:hypothetical protein n=1 Tax=unclassified Streptomyces TaxID=2593676 RepID=UPI0033C0500C